MQAVLQPPTRSAKQSSFLLSHPPTCLVIQNMSTFSTFKTANHNSCADSAYSPCLPGTNGRRMAQCVYRNLLELNVVGWGFAISLCTHHEQLRPCNWLLRIKWLVEGQMLLQTRKQNPQTPVQGSFWGHSLVSWDLLFLPGNLAGSRACPGAPIMHWWQRSLWTLHGAWSKGVWLALFYLSLKDEFSSLWSYLELLYLESLLFPCLLKRQAIAQMHVCIVCAWISLYPYNNDAPPGWFSKWLNRLHTMPTSHLYIKSGICENKV